MRTMIAENSSYGLEVPFRAHPKLVLLISGSRLEIWHQRLGISDDSDTGIVKSSWGLKAALGSYIMQMTLQCTRECWSSMSLIVMFDLSFVPPSLNTVHKFDAIQWAKCLPLEFCHRQAFGKIPLRFEGSGGQDCQ